MLNDWGPTICHNIIAGSTHHNSGSSHYMHLLIGCACRKATVFADLQDRQVINIQGY